MSNPESYVAGSELPPETMQGFIDIRDMLAAQIQEHSESDQVQQDPEGEQS